VQIEAEGVPQAIGPDLQAICARTVAREGVAGPAGAVFVDAQHLPGQHIEVLRPQCVVIDLVVVGALADGGEKRASGGEFERANAVGIAIGWKAVGKGSVVT